MSYTQQRPKLQVVREKQGLRQKSVFVTINQQPGVLQVQQIVQVRNPSRRLSVAVEAFFEPLLEPESVITAYNATWTTRARAIGIRLGDDNLHFIETAIALPRMYELDSAIRVFQVQMDFATLPTKPGPVFVFGNWYLRARWEPNTPMEDEELQQLFNDCHIE